MKPHEEWLEKAHHDLLSAIALADSQHHLYDTAVYHTQQAAEKALKAFLVFNNQEVPHTHNVRVLLTRCCVFNASLNELAHQVILVAPYDTLYRYPGEILNPTEEQTANAILSAQIIIKTITPLLS